MEPDGDPAKGRRPVVYCLVPRDVAGKLHEALCRHFRDYPQVEVVVERRGRERRRAGDRRTGALEAERPPAEDERRRINSSRGRRVADRRTAAVPVDPPPLPRKARPYAHRLTFVERLEPAPERAEDLDSARLVIRFQAGEREVFATLYMRYFDRLFSYFRLLLRSPHDAEDATQQVFSKVLAALPSYELRQQPFRAWLFIVARNLALDELRKRHRVEVTDVEEVNRRRERLSDRAAESPAFDWLSDPELVLFIERLPLPQRQVLVLRYMLDLTHGQIAAILGRGENDVAVLHGRALAFIRERLTALGRGTKRRDRSRMRRCLDQAPVLRSRRFALDR